MSAQAAGIRIGRSLAVAAAFLLGWTQASPPSQAQEHEHGERHEQGNREQGREYGRGERGERGGHRAEPPRWQAHPPGQHPHGPIVRQHQTRVLRPYLPRAGEHPWRRWEHPEFARPHYYWDWSLVHSVTCVAEYSYGDQYPVSETTSPGFGLDQMSVVEDDALDRCYQESGGDQSCFLASCSHF